MRVFQWLCMLFVSATGLMINVQAREEPPAFIRIGRGDIQSVEWSPDGNFVFVSTVTGVWLYNADLQDPGHVPNAQLATLSPDGHTIAGTLDGQNIHVWNAKTLELTRTLKNEMGLLGPLFWSPDNLKIMTSVRQDEAERIITFDLTVPDQLIFPQLGPDANTSPFFIWNSDSKSLISYDPKIVQLHVGANQFALEREPDRAIWLNSSFLLISKSDEGGTRRSLLNVATGETRRLCDGYAQIANDNALYVACGGHILTLDAESLDTLREFETECNSMSQLSLNADGTKIAAACYSRNNDNQSQIIIMDTARGTVFHRFYAPPANIYLLKWHPDGNRLLSIGNNGLMTLFDTTEGRDTAYQNAHTTSNSVMTWNDDSSLIATADSLNAVTIRDALTGHAITSFEDHAQQIQEIDWQPGGGIIAILRDNDEISADSYIRLWDVRNLSQATLIHSEYLGYQLTMAWSADGQYLSTTGTNFFSLWDIGDATSISLQKIPFTVAHIADDMRWSPDGRIVAASLLGDYGVSGIISYNFATDQLLYEKLRSERAVWAWTPTSDIFYLSRGISISPTLADPEIQIIDQPDFDKSLPDLTKTVWQGSISPTGQYAAALEDNDGLVWDTATGDVLFMFSDILQVVWSPDETKIAVERTDHTVWVMSNIGQVLYHLQETPIYMDSYERDSLTWSPDSHQLAYSHNGVIDLWQIGD